MHSELVNDHNFWWNHDLRCFYSNEYGRMSYMKCIKEIYVSMYIEDENYTKDRLVNKQA